MSIHPLASGAQHSGLQVARYEGPMGGGTSYQAAYRTSADHATAFQTSDLQNREGKAKPLSLGAQTRGSVFKWDSGSTTPSFNQN